MRIKSRQSSRRNISAVMCCRLPWLALARSGSSLPEGKRGGGYLSRDLQKSCVWGSHARLRCRSTRFRRAHNIWQAPFWSVCSCKPEVAGVGDSRRSAQDDVFVVSWRCKNQRLLGFLLSAKRVSAYGTASWAKFSHVQPSPFDMSRKAYLSG
jgi:hypothetical protein